MEECCRTGFRWDGKPTGEERTLAGHPAYVAGQNKQRAVLICHDAFGWTWTNTRLLADHYAQEIGATVYVPDFFHGHSVSADNVSWHKDGNGKLEMFQDPAFDWVTWFTKNAPDVRLPEVVPCLKELRTSFFKIAVVGFCWGGAIGFKLASKEYAQLVDCVTIAHPAAPTEEDVRCISRPFQIIAPEHDPMFSPEWHQFCNREIPRLGVEYQFHYFPGMVHGFCTRVDLGTEEAKKSLEKAKDSIVGWCRAKLA